MYHVKTRKYSSCIQDLLKNKQVYLHGGLQLKDYNCEIYGYVE